MKHKRLLIIGGLCATAGMAQFGGIVHDPINGAVLGVQVGHMVTQIANLAQQLIRLKQTYDHAVYQARALNGQAERWGHMVAPWKNTITGDRSAMNGGYMVAINTGQAVEAGYEKTVEVLRDPTSLVYYGTQEMKDRARRAYGDIERADGGNIHLLSVIGSRRAEVAQLRQKINALSQASTSDNADDNTQIAVLNKINNANMLLLAADVARDEVAAAQAELLLQQQTRERQGLAQHLNMEIEFRTNGADALNRQTAGTSEALAGMRLP